MRVLLVILALAYWVVVGHGHSWVFAAIMLAAIWNHRRRETRMRT